MLKIRKKNELGFKPDIKPLSKDVLGITDEAAVKILENKDLLRVSLRGGGCSGLSIHYEFVTSSRPEDQLFEHKGAKVCIDKKSLSMLGGATLHVSDELGVKHFILVNNPAAKQCSCGRSFSL